jgi:uncharacterized protein (TIGR03067 family)
VAALFTMDSTKSPKEVDAPEIFISHEREEQSLPGPWRGIYKFEGDELVLAFATGHGNLPRPTEFKAAGGDANQRVFVLHLKRK